MRLKMLIINVDQTCGLYDTAEGRSRPASPTTHLDQVTTRIVIILTIFNTFIITNITQTTHLDPITMNIINARITVTIIMTTIPSITTITNVGCYNITTTNAPVTIGDPPTRL